MKTIQLQAFLLFIALTILKVVSYSQAPAIEWQKTFGGTGDDRANYIEQTNDGGYIVAGVAASNDGDVKNNHGNWDCWIIKLNNVGDTLWTKTYGGSKEDGATSIRQTTDGGYIVSGYTYSNDGDIKRFQGITDCWILKLNSSGDTIWTKTLGGSFFDEATSIQQTSDGGFIMSAITASNDGDVKDNHGQEDYWIVKLNSSDDTLWTKTFGGSNAEQPHSIQQTKDGGYILAGQAASNDGDVKTNKGQDDYWIVKLNNNGDTVWTKVLGGSDYDVAMSIQQTIDNGYIIGGYTASNDGDVNSLHGDMGNYDSWIIKLNSNGDTIWTKTLGGSDSEGAYFITQTSDGGYVATSNTSSNDGDVSGNHGSVDYWIIKLNSSGDTLWTQSLGGSNDEESYCIKQDKDGKYIIAGYTISNDGDVTDNHNRGIPDYWIVKLKDDNILPITLLNFTAQKQKKYNVATMANYKRNKQQVF